ncbi:hypothetical protein, partial [Chryseobacterium sp.]|uniref:hypothetical protein n=1 Tax=Chryseobacterium sp. TaxID=1871047 RepID=UPI0025C6CA2B
MIKTANTKSFGTLPHLIQRISFPIINYLIGIICLIYALSSIKNSYLQIIVNRNGWYLGEWLINYQDGGFKRRGFFGTFFIFINELTKIKLEYIVFAFIVLIYTTFFFLL